MEQYYLAVDIGASGGRHMLASVQGKKFRMEEIYRFPNGPILRDGIICWDLERLFAEILQGLKRCREAGKIPCSMGIDTWGLDYVLLGEDGLALGNAVNHRDPRTEGIYDEIYRVISEEELYLRTGVQMAPFNTVCQLMAVKKRNPGELLKARAMVMIPDYFHYRLTGRLVTEYTNAAVTQMMNRRTKEWDYELIGRLGLPERIFLPICRPGTRLGRCLPAIRDEIGFDVEVVLPPTHDTAAAFLALPRPRREEAKNTAVISSGTWSLMGMETLEPVVSGLGRELKFTNEGGYGGRNLLLKNCMGLWMIQNIRKEQAPQLTYGEICRMAEQETIASCVDCESKEFLSPENMSRAVMEYCERTGQQVPQGASQLAAVVYKSLAAAYARILSQMTKVTGKSFSSIHILGGGAQAGFLNRLTARSTSMPVLAGPAEATAIGNAASLMISNGVFSDINQVRECVEMSFPVKRYEPI